MYAISFRAIDIAFVGTLKRLHSSLGYMSPREYAEQNRYAA